MSQLTTIDPQIKTMTSREIAELTGKAHKNVLADIRELLGALGLAVADFSAAAQVPGPPKRAFAFTVRHYTRVTPVRTQLGAMP